MTKARSGCRLVYVGTDGDLYQSGNGVPPERLTCGWSGADVDGRLYYVWPSYSPDGHHVACFGVRPGAAPEAGLYAVAQDGVSMHEIWRMRGAAPICESWSADSTRIALLLQSEEGLRLELADVRRPGEAIELESGSPLFWSWAPNRGLIAVHVGGSRSVCDEARLSIFDTDHGSEEIARLSPGEFRTPAWAPDGRRLAYIESSGGSHEYLALYRLDDGVSEIVKPVEGHSALLWSPDGRHLAVSEALGETPHVFTGVSLVDVRTGRTEVINDANLVSFFWSPCGTRLISIAFSEEGGMEWSVFDVVGHRRGLEGRFYPTRELVYFCWFFDQFAASHPLVSPDGRHLAFAGYLMQDQERMERGDSAVYLLSVSEDRAPERLAGGHFACWDATLR